MTAQLSDPLAWLDLERGTYIVWDDPRQVLHDSTLPPADFIDLFRTEFPDAPTPAAVVVVQTGWATDLGTGDRQRIAVSTVIEPDAARVAMLSIDGVTVTSPERLLGTVADAAARLWEQDR